MLVGVARPYERKPPKLRTQGGGKNRGRGCVHGRDRVEAEAGTVPGGSGQEELEAHMQRQPATAKIARKQTKKGAKFSTCNQQAPSPLPLTD